MILIVLFRFANKNEISYFFEWITDFAFYSQIADIKVTTILAIPSEKCIVQFIAILILDLSYIIILPNHSGTVIIL